MFDHTSKLGLLLNRFKLDWGTYLTTSEDVIYGTIDGRGSGYRGDDLLFEIHYNLGARYLNDVRERLDYLEPPCQHVTRSKLHKWQAGVTVCYYFSKYVRYKKYLCRCLGKTFPPSEWM